jgi:hypothetical protein
VAFLESFGSRFGSFQGCCEASRDILRLFWAVLRFFMRFQAIQEQFLGHFQAILGLLGALKAILVVTGRFRPFWNLIGPFPGCFRVITNTFLAILRLFQVV